MNSLSLFFLTLSSILSAAASSPESDSTTVILRFGGDCLLAEHYERAAENDVDRAFRGFDLFQAADLAMVNLECPVTVRGERKSKPFNFRMHPRYLSSLVTAGIDLVNIANNHIFDYDSVGLFDTIRFLDSVGVMHVGAGRNREEAHRPAVIDLKGMRIGFLGYYGGGESPAATTTGPGVAPRRIDVIRSDIKHLVKDLHADCVIVNLHWGKEKSEIPEEPQVRMAHQIIDAGASVVIGHHPHVLQGIERHGSGVIAYSLGNLVFGGNSRSSYDTAVLEISLSKDGLQYQLLPVRMEDWNLRVLTGIDAAELIQHVQQLPIPNVDTMNTETNK